jgi:hypothetical protein
VWSLSSGADTAAAAAAAAAVAHGDGGGGGGGGDDAAADAARTAKRRRRSRGDEPARGPPSSPSRTSWRLLNPRAPLVLSAAAQRDIAVGFSSSLLVFLFSFVFTRASPTCHMAQRISAFRCFSFVAS